MNSAANADGEEDEQLGTLTANESGGMDITVTAEDGTTKTYTFTDVAPDAWYAQAVDYVVSNGVMSGDEAQNLFRPVMYVVPSRSMRIASTVTGTGFLGRV